MLQHPVISTCGTTTEQVSEFLYHHLQSAKKDAKGNRLDKLKDLGEIQEGVTVLTVLKLELLFLIEINCTDGYFRCSIAEFLGVIALGLFLISERRMDVEK